MAAKQTPARVRRAAVDIGHQLTIWRRMQDLTAVQVAERANISRDTLRRLEHGDPGVSMATLLGARPLGRRPRSLSDRPRAGPGNRGAAQAGAALTEVQVHVDVDRRPVLAGIDDHLRNHGFRHRRGGWSLSPIFDVNPDPNLARPRATSVMGAVDAGDEADALLDLAAVCRLAPDRVRGIVERVVAVVRDWRAAATANGVAPRELPLFADAIEAQLGALRKVARASGR